MTTRAAAVLILLFCACAVVPAPVAGQGFVFSDVDPVASAERYGNDFPVPESVAGPPPRWEPEGSSRRICVEVGRTPGIVRSGEIVIGGDLERLRVGLNKLWWKPLNSSLEMTLHLASRSLDDRGGKIDFEIARPTSPHTNDVPPQPIVEEAFFPGGATFPSAGRWIVVATSGDNWGCFVFTIPDAPTALR